MPATTSSRARQSALLASLLVSLGIVAYLFAKLDWAEVWIQLHRVNLWIILPLTVAFGLTLWMRAMRWRLLLPGGEHLSVARLMDATILGFFANTVLPLRAGEIIRPWVVSRWQPVTFSASLASIMIERLADSVCMLSLLVLCLTEMPEIPAMVSAGAKALGLLSGSLILVVLLSYLLPGRMERFFHRISDLVMGRFAPHATEKINAMITEYFVGLRVLSSFWQLIQVVLWSFAMWLMVAAWYQALLWAFGEYPTFWVGMVLNVMVALAVAAPSAPGFVGTFQVGCLIALSTIYGFSKEFAMAYSVIAHLLQMVLIVAAGLLVLHLRGLSFSQLREVKSDAPVPPPAG